MFYCTVSSPLGILTLASDGAALTGLWLPGQKYFALGLRSDAVNAPDLPVFQAAKAWITAYFAKDLLPEMPTLDPVGTPFRKAVWQKLMQIPAGEVVTYGTLAAQLRQEGIAASPRAVGGAVGHNPISIMIPCHRVIGSGGKLTGYAGGLQAKTYLLELEGVRIPELRQREVYP